MQPRRRKGAKMDAKRREKVVLQSEITWRGLNGYRGCTELFPNSVKSGVGNAIGGREDMDWKSMRRKRMGEDAHATRGGFMGGWVRLSGGGRIGIVALSPSGRVVRPG